jgi:hypothetical protein
VGGVWQEANSSSVDRSKRRLGIKYMLIKEEKIMVYYKKSENLRMNIEWKIGGNSHQTLYK